MKRICTIGLALLMLALASGVMAQDWEDDHRDHRGRREHGIMDFSTRHGFTGVADVRIKVKRHAVRILPEDEYERGRVEITEDYDLYINGDKIKTSKKDRALLEKYFELSQDVMHEARRIGYEGAEVGMEGAKLGIKAMAGVFKMISPHYSSEDLERDIERDAEKIERKAERLEEKAEVVEDVVDELEDVHKKLRRQVKSLKKLDWF